MEALGISYTNLMSKYWQAFHEAENLRLDKDAALKDKETEIAQLKSQLDKMRSLYEQLSPDMKKQVLSRSDIVRKFKAMATPQKENIQPCHQDWTLLTETMEYSNPKLYGRILASNHLTQQETWVSLLTMLHFSNTELTVLLNISKQRVTNLKASANSKLFGEKGATTFLANLENK